MTRKEAAVRLRIAAFDFVKGGPIIDSRDSTGMARNRKLLHAAFRYAEAVRVERARRKKR